MQTVCSGRFSNKTVICPKIKVLVCLTLKMICEHKEIITVHLGHSILQSHIYSTLNITKLTFMWCSCNWIYHLLWYPVTLYFAHRVCIYGFRIALRINGDYFHKKHWPFDVFNKELACFLCSMNWIFKYYLKELWLKGD